ncbi:sterol desaturase/sphingolipid hydroxylase (fatty acid hydroxylase superfamily) [Caulobacter ginsengisoli]|uniref:Sterol desaturase/sphingolipid hydroxylase (Fatty acid hydroxylase superfamily) n=1 Tax=Caulobacter ginsengisoli TaxID=400775 RepID=A0ABU0IT40_9CAUL|nr:sterol desaturase family protein [Caulobacter ginsengisoli]MDQ0465168.1 sterol desaturase/sphingolipid hydroxylase (fatty acid hydroxylase superfamily) [Caulobacter ginsengisoli]
MNLSANLSSLALLLAAMILLSGIEVLIPLQARGGWSRRHLLPNLALTFLTFATNLVFNIPLLLGLVWLQSKGWGLFNLTGWPPVVELAGAVLALDLAWYVTHVTMHRFAALWRFHAVHHSDPMVDVTTTIRQHPGESVIRYVFLAVFAFAFGASPAGFMIYRIWSALHGLFEHANLRLPQWLDTTITLVFSSPNMHKIHHARDRRHTDRNYTNIFSIWDRLFGTFTPSSHGRDIVYGLDGLDGADQQTTLGLLALPFRDRSGEVAAPLPSARP